MKVLIWKMKCCKYARSGIHIIQTISLISVFFKISGMTPSKSCQDQVLIAYLKRRNKMSVFLLAVSCRD